MKSIGFVKERIASGLANVPLQDDAKFTELRFDYVTDSWIKI